VGRGGDFGALGRIRLDALDRAGDFFVFFFTGCES